MDHCSIQVKIGSIFSALFTINSLYGFISQFVSSILNSFSCSISCHNVSVFIILPDYTFLYTCLAYSSVKYQVSLGLLLFTCPPILVLRGKNVVGSFLPFYKFECPGFRLSSELMLLRLSYVFLTKGLTDICSSSKLSIFCFFPA